MASTGFYMVDLDHFKRVNDTYGHDCGDAVLVEFAQRVRNLLRQGDCVCRMGGEEFLLIAPETDVQSGTWVGERVRKAIADEPFKLPNDEEIQVTCSLGLCYSVVGLEDVSFDEFVKNADEALYQSKHQGRNRLTVFKGD